MKTFDIDSVPAPSKFDPVHLPRPKRYGFDGAAKLLNINEDRERFHRWAGRFVNLSIAYLEGSWRLLYQTFVQFETDLDHLQKDADARDQDDTQQDSIAPPW